MNEFPTPKVKSWETLAPLCLSAGRAAVNTEADALRLVAIRLGNAFVRAVALILSARGNIIVTGLGKSGLIGQKLAATLCSTGTRAIFMHPAEAFHGDFGVVSRGDVAILISNSGTTAELVRLVPFLRQLSIPLIGVLGNSRSPLARQLDVVLDASVESEADPLHVAPTSSAVAALGLGDALASALMVGRNFTIEDYSRLHPGGQLGRNLCLKVRDVMHCDAAVAWVGVNDSLKDVVIQMTHHPLGAACVVNEDGALAGLITDGDIRRALQKFDNIRNVSAIEVMTVNPTTVGANSPLREALRLMENRASQISVLPVIEESRCIGLIRIHDIYRPTREIA